MNVLMNDNFCMHIVQNIQGTSLRLSRTVLICISRILLNEFSNTFDILARNYNYKFRFVQKFAPTNLHWPEQKFSTLFIFPKKYIPRSSYLYDL